MQENKLEGVVASDVMETGFDLEISKEPKKPSLLTIVPPEVELVISETYSISTPDSREAGEYESSGFREENESYTLSELKDKIDRDYVGAEANQSGFSAHGLSISANDVRQDADHFEKGEVEDRSLFYSDKNDSRTDALWGQMTQYASSNASMDVEAIEEFRRVELNSNEVDEMSTSINQALDHMDKFDKGDVDSLSEFQKTDDNFKFSISIDDSEELESPEVKITFPGKISEISLDKDDALQFSSDLDTYSAGLKELDKPLQTGIEIPTMNSVFNDIEDKQGHINVFEIEIDEELGAGGWTPAPSGTVKAVEIDRTVTIAGEDFNQQAFAYNNPMDNYFRYDVVTEDAVVGTPELISQDTPKADLEESKRQQAEQDRISAEQREMERQQREMERQQRIEQDNLARNVTEFEVKESINSKIGAVFDIPPTVDEFIETKSEGGQPGIASPDITRGDLNMLHESNDILDRYEAENGNFPEVEINSSLGDRTKISALNDLMKVEQFELDEGFRVEVEEVADDTAAVRIKAGDTILSKIDLHVEESWSNEPFHSPDEYYDDGETDITYKFVDAAANEDSMKHRGTGDKEGFESLYEALTDYRFLETDDQDLADLDFKDDLLIKEPLDDNFVHSMLKEDPELLAAVKEDVQSIPVSSDRKMELEEEPALTV